MEADNVYNLFKFMNVKNIMNIVKNPLFLEILFQSIQNKFEQSVYYDENCAAFKFSKHLI